MTCMRVSPQLIGQSFYMFLIHGDRVLDPDLNLLNEILTVIDRHLETVINGWSATAIADELGYFDRIEHVTGLGFVACQAYMTATYGFMNVAKLGSLSKGPRHKSGLSIAELVNHAANYWKHRDEWHLDKGFAKQKRVREAFDSIGFPVDTDYPLSGILTELAASQSASFSPLIEKLEEWRDAVRKAASTSQC
jgi:hypothetical protein